MTEAALAEERLEEAEERYRRLVERLPAIVYVQETNGRMSTVYDSPQIETMLGYPRDKYVEDPDYWLKILHPDDRERVPAGERRAIASGEPLGQEYRVLASDGRTVWVRDEAVIVRGRDEGRSYLQGFIFDITERKEAEQRLRQAEARYRALVEQIPAVTYTQGIGDPSYTTYVSPQMETMLGYRPEECTSDPRHWMKIMHPDDRERILAEDRRTNETGEPFRAEFRQFAKDGSVVWVRDEATLVRDDEGNPSYWLGVQYDITERRRAEEELRRNEARHRAVLDNAFDAVITATADGTIRSFNRRAETMFGYGANEVVGQPLELLMPERGRHPSGFSGDVEEGRLGRTFETTARRKGGAEFPIELSLAEVREGDNVLLTGIVRDITERKLFEAQLTYQALHDPLTRLPNRTLFLDRLEQALSQTRRRRGATVAVLFMDLDDFKNVNDSLGHEVGDELLKAVGARLKSRLRPGDTAARLGGDEFAVLLEDVRSVRDASLVAQRIIEDLRAPLVLMGYEFFFTTSIGISLSTSERYRAEEMLRDADLAMYRAKEKGKSTYQVFDSTMYRKVLDRLSLERDLRRACRRDEFVVHYQPKIRLQTGRIYGVEALVRWDRPGRGLVPPEEFVPVAEENGLIVPIGRKTLEEACRRASEWRELYPGDLFTVVSVNLSASQLQHSGLLEETVATLQRTGLDPRNLNLEITESVMMSDAPANTVTLEKLRALGIELAIDDFGKGYSSLSYLKHFPVSYLKVDRSFVEELREGSEDRAVVSGIIALAHTLGMHVIAEGVKSAEQLRILRELGCDMAQGYYFSEPLTYERMSALLASDPRW